MEIVNQLKELKKWRTKIDQLESQIEYCVEESNKITGPIYNEQTDDIEKIEVTVQQTYKKIS